MTLAAPNMHDTLTGGVLNLQFYNKLIVVVILLFYFCFHFTPRNHRKPSLLSSTVSSPFSEDTEKPDKDIDSLLMQFDTHGQIEFKMDERTYRMIPLANSEDYLYRRNSLRRAKVVSLHFKTDRHT